jgi:tRNA(fMet)-specific endonuclease VapC
MNIVLDTNRYADVDRAEPSAAAFIRTVNEICVPTIVLGELRYGFLYGSKATENEKRLQHFISGPRVRILTINEATTHHYSELMLQLRRNGTMIPTNDVWIAALTFQHGLKLYTRDNHFNLLRQIPLV